MTKKLLIIILAVVIFLVCFVLVSDSTMRTNSEILTAKLFNNPLGRWYLDVPEGKEIYKITHSSAHYYTGEIAKNGMPIITTGDVSPGSKLPFISWIENLKLMFVNTVFALDTGAKAPGTSGGALNQWTNPDNAKVDDGTYATTYWAADAEGTLYQSYYNFNFGITAGATINGIEIKVEGHFTRAGGTAIGVSSAPNVNNNPGGQGNLGSNQNLNLNTDTILTYGGATTLPTGYTPTAAQLNDNSNFTQIYFGTSVGYEELYSRNAYIDYVTVKVYYTEAPPASSVISQMIGWW